MTLSAGQVDALLAATWPPAATRTLGPWTLRDGAGGGKRVSAASTDVRVTETDIDAAERAMDDAGQQALFQVRAGQEDLDRRLTDRAYLTLDPTNLYECPVETLSAIEPGPVTGFSVWPPLEIQKEIWAAGGIGAARLAVMERVSCPKITILGRMDDQPASTVFAAVHEGVAMIHALETAKRLRRRGSGRLTLIHAARWAEAQGARSMALLVTRANVGANAMYIASGMAGRPCYHYRIRP
ncbi:GNAT family N-acetyltransferase [Palleronia sp. LCG004]|uniref:GNAT family N-acetyltransferase n=1 Tax=Palleronia sp. LCG004 TaxID=3079304 RepID=UPI0029420874|nr:GNAT family N-acetyltransferase [Palleronia sp. LCG004]WOI56044.1 GNAT family N-acetyltransferase [Palleronia sp. LCG004]